MTNPPDLSTEDFARLNEQLASLGDGNLAELADYEHDKVRLSPDEVYRMYAIHAYRIAFKFPAGNISRPAAGIIMGILDQMTDEGIADEFVGMEGYITQRCDDMPSALGRMLQILCKRRGLGSLVDERKRAILAPSSN